MFIFRRSNCIVTASGIVTLRKQLFSAPFENNAMQNKESEYINIRTPK